MRSIIICAGACALVAAGFACSNDDETTSSAGPSSTTTASTVAASSTSGSGGSGTGGGGAGGAGGMGSACLPPDVLATLNAHVDELFATTQLTASHPSEFEAVSFYAVPGMPTPPAISAQFASLFMICSAPTLYDPFCEEGRCTRIECTGDGAGLIVHAYLDAPPFVSGDWNFATADLDIAWADGATGITFTIALDATGPAGKNWAMTGNGSMDLGVLEISEVFTELFPEGDGTMTYNADPNTASGSIDVAGVDVATVDMTHHFVPTGDCP